MDRGSKKCACRSIQIWQFFNSFPSGCPPQPTSAALCSALLPSLLLSLCSALLSLALPIHQPCQKSLCGPTCWPGQVQSLKIHDELGVGQSTQAWTSHPGNSIHLYMMPLLGSHPHMVSPPPGLLPGRPNPCNCLHFFHMAAPKPSTVTRISSQTHPILVTGHTFQPRLRHQDLKLQLSGGSHS